jgi:hypothetical protein
MLVSFLNFFSVNVSNHYKSLFMKTQRILHGMMALLMALSVMVLPVSCDKDNDDDENTYSLSGVATGGQEVPATASTGTASLTGSYNANTNTLVYNINWSGLSGVLTAAHFHGPAAAGETASPLYDITVVTNGTSGNASGTIVISEANEAHFLSGKVYYNLHTALYPNGEVRSQVGT